MKYFASIFAFCYFTFALFSTSSLASFCFADWWQLIADIQKKMDIGNNKIWNSRGNARSTLHPKLLTLRLGIFYGRLFQFPKILKQLYI